MSTFKSTESYRVIILSDKHRFLLYTVSRDGRYPDCGPCSTSQWLGVHG